MDQEIKPVKPKPGKLPQLFSIVFIVISVIAFQAVAPIMFPPSVEGGYNPIRTLLAIVVGAVFAFLGLKVGELIEKSRK